MCNPASSKIGHDLIIESSEGEILLEFDVNASKRPLCRLYFTLWYQRLDLLLYPGVFVEKEATSESSTHYTIAAYCRRLLAKS